jgi:hypothetical protein
MLAAVAAALEDQPLISGDAIRQAMLDHAAELGGADLADAPSPVRITPEAYTLDDLSKLWSVFFQVPYALSAAYMCSHVSIETGADAAPAQPISRRGAWVAPVNGVAVTGLEGGAGPGAPIVWGGALTVRGRGLNAPGLRLRIGGRDVPLAEGEARADAIRIDLAPARFGGAELPAGVHRVQAVLPPPPGAPDHLARATDARAFGLRPQLTVNAVDPDPGAPAGEARGVLTVGFVPAAAQGQQVRLMLDERVAAAPRAAILAPDPPGAFPAAELRFAYAGLRPGRHLVRAQVDGVESAVELDATPGAPTEGEITGPEADLP